MELDSNNHSVFKLYYHLILVVKYRKKVIDFYNQNVEEITFVTINFSNLKI